MEASPVIRAEPSAAVETFRLSQVRVEEPFTLVIFGATGALTSSKLLPALYRLWQENYFAAPFAIVGVGRREKNDAHFRNQLREAVVSRDRELPADSESWVRFAASLYYHRADFNQAESYPALTERLHALNNQLELTWLKLLHVLHVERNKCRRTGDESCIRCSANESIIVGYWLGTFSQLLHGFEFAV